MAQARPLLVGALLVALALPGHPLAPFSGLPLDLPALCLLLFAVGSWIALPGAPPRAGLFAGALLGLGVLKLLLWWQAPAYGLSAEYRAGEAPVGLATISAERPGTVRTDLALDLQGDEFPVHFFNDIRRFNYYTANDPKRDLLPFSVRWTGLLVVPASRPLTLTLEANGPASLEIGGRRVEIERGGRVRDVDVTVDLPAGLAPITVTYTRPDEAMPWLVVRDGAPAAQSHSGLDAPSLGAPLLVREGTSEASVARDTWLRQIALLVSAAVGGVTVLAFLVHVASLARRASWPRAHLDRALLGLYVLLAGGREIVAHVHLHGRAVILSGGNDWLAYESYARDALINGPLITEGRALGQGLPFYYQPLYIYWLALSHLLLGEGLFAALLMNTMLGIAAALGLYLLTRELFGRAAGLAVVPLFEAYRLTVFAPTAGLLLSENLVIPLVPLVLLLLVRLAKSGRWKLSAGAGLLLGLGGLARTTPLALLPPALLILLYAFRRLGIGWLPSFARLTLLVAVCTTAVGLATTRNYIVSGRPVPITSSAGANLWEAHRPSAKVDLSRIDRDPLYERLGLDRQTREVLEFARQDPAGYTGTLAPMFLYAVGVTGAVVGTWEIHPGLFGMWVAYLLVTLLVRRARAMPTWFLHAFVWSHLAQMTVFFSHQYGFRLILPMYVGMAPVVALGIVAAVARVSRRLAPLTPRLTARATVPPAARASLLVLALVGGVGGLGAGGWRGSEAAREAFYGLNGDAALAERQATRRDLLRAADAMYFVGDDSRSTDVAYLRGLAYPALRWFDGARGLVLPPPGDQALYIVPDRAAADLAKRCLGEGAVIGRERDPVLGVGLELLLATTATPDCATPRLAVGAPFAETGTLLGLDAPASIEPGRPMDVLIYWEASARPLNRARPFVRLVDTRGRRWGQAETAVYPSSSWHPGERAIGLARLELDPALPPGEYLLETGFSAGSGQARLADGGDWRSAGLAQARAGSVRLVGRSAPLGIDALPLDRRTDAVLDGARLLGVDFDRTAARAGERLRLSLFWQASAARPERREVTIVLRDRGGRVLQEWRGEPVDATYPTAGWRPGEIVRDTWDLTLPAILPTGDLELAAGLASPGSQTTQYASLGAVTVQAASRQLTAPAARARLEGRFENAAELVSVDSRARRIRPGENLDMTLVWRASTPIQSDAIVAVALLDEAGRIIVQQESEPGGGKRPTTGWTADEFVEDEWRVRVPRDLPRGKVRVAVSLVDPIGNRRLAANSGGAWVELPIEVGGE